MKNQLNVKLGARVIEQIKALAAQRGESQANVITIAIDRMAREEKETMYYVDREMLGDDATAADVSRMCELLQERGVDAVVGSPLHFGHDPDACPDAVWDECLDILSREKYSK